MSTGKFTLTFGGGASAGAQFLVTSPNRTDGPWTYTTEAGKTVSDTWNTAYSGGVTNLSVYGPNGFLRTFRNPGKTAGPEVTARHNAGTGNLDLTMTNAGKGTVHLTVASAAAYGGATQTFTVAAGATVRYTVALRAGKNWYDVSVTSDADATFLRRFAGHVETGATGVSDPGLLTT